MDWLFGKLDEMNGQIIVLDRQWLQRVIAQANQSHCEGMFSLWELSVGYE